MKHLLPQNQVLAIISPIFSMCVFLVLHDLHLEVMALPTSFLCFDVAYHCERLISSLSYSHDGCGETQMVYVKCEHTDHA